jgi:polysaccharide export outer membrane protein
MKPILSILLLILAAGIAAGQARPAASAEVAGANLPALRIGPNDLIAVAVYDSPELTRTVRVGPDGVIRLPMLQRKIKADKLLPSELEASIAAALSAEQILVDPVVTVTIAEYHSRPISVAGSVRNPVTFQAAGPVTLLDALTRAGGLSPEAGPEILVSRTQTGEDGQAAALVQRIPVKLLIDAADPESNLKLAGGEEIRVPEVGKIYVVGTVMKPGAFPVQSGSETTVLQMLALAEGLAPFASKQAFVYRLDSSTGTKNEIAIPLGKILGRKAGDVPLQPNDILYIPDNQGRRLTVTTIEKLAGFGSATASGMLIWKR